jgi:hypothetical protein
MASRYDVGPYDPCPCGSGAKYKFCCAAKAKANRRGKFPIGTVCYYGPDDKTTTKIAAGVILSDNAEPILERFDGTNVVNDPKVAEQVKRFFARHGVKSVAITDGNLGCPHEEGSDFPEGADCPFCPFWAGKQGTARRDDAEDEWEEDDEAPDDDKEEEEKEEERDWDAAFARADAILGGREVEDLDEALDLMLAHLRKNLQLPCEVTGIEDFQWEEPYILGGWSPAEYRRLKKTQPSYTDRFQLIAVSRDEDSEWMMSDEDIAARVRRISDGREFVLGLAELEALDKHSRNYQLLDDYAVWFANSR